MKIRILHPLAALAALTASILPLEAHNLDTTATSISFAGDFVATMSQRASLNQTLVQQGDEFWVLLKTTPGPGTDTGVGGYQTFYVPDGLQVLDAAYVFPDATDPRGFRNIPMKGQSPIAIGNGSIGSASSPELIGFDLPGVNGLGFDTNPVTATGVHRGTLAGVYADTGIFFTTDPRLGFNSYGVPVPPLTGAPLPMKNNSGDTAGEYFAENITNSTTRKVLGVMTLWDSYQLRAYGRSDVSPLLDSNGRGTAPWGLANVVAGPQSGYAWEFDFNAYQNTPGTNAQKIQAAIKIGPWNRIKYPGSQISQDQPGLVSNVLGQAGIDASLMGIDPSAMPADTKAVRMAIGQLELGRPEYSAVKVRVNVPPGGGDCKVMNADAFGGDAGGTEGGKDHIWRYFDPTVVSLNPCTFLQKVASKSLVAPGETFYYDITFANTGSISLPNFTITDVLPSGLTHVSATPAQNTISGQTLTWNCGTVEPGDFVTIRHYVRATGTGTLFNTATARSGINVVGVAQASVEVSVRAILEKNKTVTPSAVAPGDTVTYTLNIENLGTGNNGVPLIVREFLPPGFTIVSLQDATLNGATITSPTISTNSSNPALPVFTVNQGIEPGKKLVIRFTALVAANVQPGTYWNSFQLEYEGKIVPPIPEAPVIVAGGKIGDTVWRDWNGNGVQDASEPGFSGVTVQLYAADGTTLLRTTTTDSNGNYYFPGLVAGTYVVKVVQPASTTQTGDPDGTINNSHTVNLATDQQYLTADFGYRPSGSGAIGDLVFEDVGNDGAFNSGTDTGISGVQVKLYIDQNGNGVVDSGDVLLATTTTSGTGAYLFSGLATGYKYIAKVETADSALATYFGASPYQSSTANPHVVPTLAGSYLAADFGFWRVAPGTIGDQVFIDANGDGIYTAGVDSPLAGVTVTLYRDGNPIATTESSANGTYLFGNLGPGNYTVSVDTTDPQIPTGYAASQSSYKVALPAGVNFLTADFPFSPLIGKTVDKSFATAGQTLNYGINLSYNGSSMLDDVLVRDFMPVGTTFGSAGQGGIVTTFSSQPGVPGEAIIGSLQPRVYAFVGGGSAAFYSYTYAAGAGSWAARPNAPGAITTGGAMTSDGSRYLYAFQGSSRAFYRYDPTTTSWSDAAVADLPGGASTTTSGSSLVHLDGKVYAFLGGGNAFWVYTVSTNSWAAANSAPGSIGSGGGLATDGTDIFALAGGGTQTTYKYAVSTGTWSTLANVGQNIGAGSGFVFADDGLFYATTGAGQNRSYSYDQDTGSWTEAGSRDFTPNTGGDLATDGVNFYGLLGNNTTTFSQRSFTSATTALTPIPAAVNSGGALAFLLRPDGIATSSLSATPTIVAVGSPITVTLTLNSTTAATGVVPSALVVTGGGATVSGPSLASLNLSANTPATVTYTVTPTTPGELTFSASAAGGLVTFATATSNSVLSSPNGQNQYVVWNLGSNEAGSSGVTAQNKYFYAFGGGDNLTFWTHNTANSTWNSPLDPTDTPAGVTVNSGGALTNDGTRYIYALRGDDTRVFLRHDTSNNTWDDTGIADLPATTDKTVLKGGSLVFMNGFVYALLGNDSTQFWRYTVSSNTWTQMTGTPGGGTVNNGAGLTTDGTNIYATQGDGKKGFWRYNVADGTWTVLAPYADNFGDGGGLVYANGAIYVLRGAGQQTFRRYNIGANTWTTLTQAPGNIDDGGAIAYDGSFIYVMQGRTTGFWRYNINTNAWNTTLNAAPAAIAWGGALTYLATGNVSTTSATASPTLRMGVSQVKVRMTVTSPGVVNNIAANAPTYSATSGITATFSAATLISADANISGTGDPVIYEWTATVTPGSMPGEIIFTTSNSAGTGATAETNSVIVSPKLTYSAIVVSNPPAVIENTAYLRESSGTIPSTPSNRTETATSASIGDRVWSDLDGDGIQDAGELGIGGVTVNLYASDGVTLLASTTTDSLGSYHFFGRSAGNYVVSYVASTAPAGYLASTPLTVAVALATGQQFIDADFGLYSPPAGTGSIGDYVWIDADNDGVQDVGEFALPNVTVRLERLINGNWVANGSTVTGANGDYNFTGLSAASYRVTVDTTSQITSPYAQGTFSLGSVMAATFDRDGTSTPHVALVTLATNSTVVTNADFGYNWSGSIGDFVWWDYNTDGLQNESPLVGIVNARVQLYFDKDFDGVFARILGDYEILRVFTQSNGTYHIPNLPPGNYFVDVYEDSITTGGLRNIVPTTDEILPVNLTPASMNPTTADFGYYEGARVEATVFWDVNHNGIRDAEPLLANITVTLTGTGNFGNPVTETALTDSNGNVTFLVPAGDYTISYAPAGVTANYPALGTPTTPLGFVFEAVAGDDGIRRFDFGVDNTGAIGDTIYADTDSNGSQGASEPGLAGVTVNLYFDANGDGTIDYAAGDLLLETVLTDSTGKYNFAGLADTTGAQRYMVEALTGTLPSGYQTVPTGFPVGTNTATSRYSTALTGGQVISIVDFGYPPVPATYRSISGTVYNDNGAGGGTASDGTKNGSEPGLPSVTVTVQVDTDANGTFDQTYTIPTDANGFYSLGGILQGSNVRITVNTASLPSTAFVQTGDPNGAPLSNVFNITNLQVNTNNLDFGYVEDLGSIAGTVVRGNGNGNGIAESGEPGVASVPVALTYAGVDGILGTSDDEVFNTTTNSSGDYSFTGLRPGPYQVTTTVPSIYKVIADADGGNPNNISLTLALGADVTDRDFEYKLGSISGIVRVDNNNDGTPDTIRAGAILSLLDGNGNPVLGAGNVPITTVTAPDGTYRFDNLPAGNYHVAKTPDSGFKSISDVDGGNPDLIGLPTAIVVIAGEETPNRDFLEMLQKCPDLWTDWQDKWDTILGGDTAFTDNPDGDRYSNLLEYAFCMPPHSGGRKPFCLTASLSVAGAVDGVFSRTAGGPLDVTYILDYAADLGDPTVWSSLTLNSGNTTVTNNGNGGETVRIVDLESKTGLTLGKGFVRIRVQLDNGVDIAEDSTEALGWVETELGLCCRTYNNPFLACATFTGTVDSVNGQELVLTNSAGPISIASLLLPGVSYFIEVETGDMEGHRFDVTSATATSLVIANDSSLNSATAPFNTLGGAAPTLLAGDRIALHTQKTLNSLFPPASFGAGANQTVSDEVQVFAGGTWKIYWLQANGGSPRWVDAAHTTPSDQGSTVISPGQGVFFHNRTAIAPLLAYGEVRGHDFHRPLFQGVNMVGGGYPIDQSATGTNSRQLNLADGFFGSTNFKTADSFFIWRTDSLTTSTGYDTYFLLDGGVEEPLFKRWVKVGDKDIIQQDAALLFKRDGAVMTRVATDKPDYLIPTPWKP